MIGLRFINAKRFIGMIYSCGVCIVFIAIKPGISGTCETLMNGVKLIFTKNMDFLEHITEFIGLLMVKLLRGYITMASPKEWLEEQVVETRSGILYLENCLRSPNFDHDTVKSNLNVQKQRLNHFEERLKQYDA